MTGSGYTTEKLPVSMCCASWRAKPQHEDCPGVVRVGNIGTIVPCGCELCADRPNHRPTGGPR